MRKAYICGNRFYDCITITKGKACLAESSEYFDLSDCHIKILFNRLKDAENKKVDTKSNFVITLYYFQNIKESNGYFKEVYISGNSTIEEFKEEIAKQIKYDFIE